MKTKEAIEFVNIFRGKEGKKTEQILSCEEWNFKLDSLIKLLEEGEKCKEMWRELKKDKYCLRTLEEDMFLHDVTDELEQKYLL